MAVTRRKTARDHIGASGAPNDFLAADNDYYGYVVRFDGVTYTVGPVTHRTPTVRIHYLRRMDNPEVGKWKIIKGGTHEKGFLLRCSDGRWEVWFRYSFAWRACALAAHHGVRQPPK